MLSLFQIMCSKDAVQSEEFAEQKQKDSNDAGLSSVELVPDSSESKASIVDHYIRTFRNGRLMIVQELTSNPRKVKTMDAILGIDKSTPSPGISKRANQGSQKSTPSTGVGTCKDLESQQATCSLNTESQEAIPSPAVKKRKKEESQQDNSSPGIKRHKRLEVQQATPSPGVRKHQIAGSQHKTKSLTILSSQKAKHKYQVSESATEDAPDINDVQEGNFLGKQNGDLIHWNVVDAGRSSKSMQQTFSDGTDDDSMGIFLKDYLKHLKSKKKNKSGSTKPIKVSNKLINNGISCDEFYSGGTNMLSGISSSTKTPVKRKNRSEEEDDETKTGEMMASKDEETLAYFKDKAFRKLKSQRTSLCQAQHQAGFQLNDQEQGVSEVTAPENSGQDIICLESAVMSCTVQLNNKMLQEMTDINIPENSMKTIPTSEISCGKLDSANSSVMRINCQSYAVEEMELEKPKSKRQRFENGSAKLNSEKVPYLVDLVLEPAADDKHTRNATPIDTQKVACGAGLDAANLSVLSEEKYHVGHHRSFSPGTKVQLFSSRANETQDKENGSFIGKPKCNFIDLFEDLAHEKRDKSVIESSQVENTIATSVVDVINAFSACVEHLPTEPLMEQDVRGESFQELPAKLPSARKLMTPYSQERLLQASDFKHDFPNSPSAGCALPQSESDAAHKMNMQYELNDTNSTMRVLDFSSNDAVNGFTFQSSDANGLESPCNDRQSLQVDDFKRVFTKSLPAGCPSQQCKSELDAAEKVDVDSHPCDANSKGFTFQSTDVTGSPRNNKRLVHVEDFRVSFTKSPPPVGSASQPSNSDAANINVVSSDTKSKDFTFQSPDFKRLGNPIVNKSPIRRQNSPFPHRKSPQSRLYNSIPLVADRLGSQTSPLPQRNISENNYLANYREEASPSSTIKSILKSPGICPTACKCDICYSIQSRAEKASAFTQRQMRDIENLANNLLSELNSMRTIVEENLNSEAVRLTVEEMKGAAASALEAEETTKKWIAMMSRDCNRFCQIMQRSVDKKPSFSIDCEKQQKKIIFADEAGKELCHFKIFENDEKEENRQMEDCL
ncbi:uncharacterized protein LOC131064728 [Cryptomeria japonica]|uniref:uncharacterized protein LOC131064728 n=1 Tax=Cryptomeria japonica TaxID=3369 RepID=UPI0025AB9A9F|nr:uncharacterized protein LOC131064728 [Cryptomeria japonica]XP_057854975.1 uncharacterized protein LOC131064728 [Cryptomeria japonica]